MPTEKGLAEILRLLEEGEVASRSGDWQAARDAAQRALAIDPTSVPGTALAERAASMLGREPGAPPAPTPPSQRELMEILRLLDLGEAAVRDGDRSRALRVGQRVLAIDPSNAPGRALVERATSIGASDADAARSESTTPNHHQLIQVLRLLDEGEAAGRAGNWRLAWTRSQQALAITPDNMPARALAERAASMRGQAPPAAGTSVPARPAAAPRPIVVQRGGSTVWRNIAIGVGGFFAFIFALGLVGTVLGDDDEDGGSSSAVASAPACSSTAHQAYLLAMSVEAIELSELTAEMGDAIGRGDVATARRLSFEIEALYETLGSHSVPSGFAPLQREVVAAADAGSEAMPLFRDGLASASPTLLSRAADLLEDSNAAVTRASAIVNDLPPGGCP